MRIAICYDWLDSFGGAERVLAVLLQIYPEADVYSLVADKHIGWIGNNRVCSSAWNYVPLLRMNRPLTAFLSHWLWQTFSFKTYDLVISVTTDQAKAVKHSKHICYCLTPPRYLWSQFYYYTKNGFYAVILRLFGTPLRVLDYYHTRRIKQIIAVSDEVRMRIFRAYRLDARVVYPPVSRIEEQ